MTHSSGPYHVGEGLASHIIYNEQGYAVGNTSTYHNRITPEQAIANAILFAAAPAMLRALYQAEDGLAGAIASWRQENGDIASTRGALKAVRKAIAKAKGE